MFYSYFYKSKNGWGYGNTQIKKVPTSIVDIFEVEKMILKNLQEKNSEIEEVKILNYQSFF